MKTDIIGGGPAGFHVMSLVKSVDAIASWQAPREKGRASEALAPAAKNNRLVKPVLA